MVELGLQKHHMLFSGKRKKDKDRRKENSQTEWLLVCLKLNFT